MESQLEKTQGDNLDVVLHTWHRVFLVYLHPASVGDVLVREQNKNKKIKSVAGGKKEQENGKSRSNTDHSTQ